jgi:hypothetical protein
MAYQSHHCSATLLCSACISVFLLTLLCSFCSSTFYALCTMSILCAMPLHALHCTTVLPFRLFTASHPTHNIANKKKLSSLLCSACLSHASPLHDHHRNSSSSLAVMLNVFIISGHYPEILWLLWQSQLFVFSVSYSQSFWLLWLLSPFLHVTTGGDQTPIQKVLPELSLVSTSSIS